MHKGASAQCCSASTRAVAGIVSCQVQGIRMSGISGLSRGTLGMAPGVSKASVAFVRRIRGHSQASRGIRRHQGASGVGPTLTHTALAH